MSETDKSAVGEVKTTSTSKAVSAPKNCVASFIRKRDNQRIYVFPRRGESRENAIVRVLRHNGSDGADVQPVTT